MRKKKREKFVIGSEEEGKEGERGRQKRERGGRINDYVSKQSIMLRLNNEQYGRE